MINYGRQSIEQDDIDAVVAALKSDFLTQGPAIVAFEKAITDYTGARFCVAVSNGTAALHIAIAALELDPDEEGITSPNTFVASSNAMIYNQLTPRFADIDPISYNISVRSIDALINDKTGLIIPVHFAGQPCDMKKIYQLCNFRRIKIIEDAAHAIGSSYRDGDKVGSCKYSDMTVFSFHPVKTITTGEGGAITTNSPQLYQRLLDLRSHGITKDPERLNNNPGPWYYEMQELGYNYRLTDIQASLGIAQMKKLDMFMERRRAIVSQYNRAFKDITWLIIPKEKDDVISCFHLYVVKIKFDSLGLSRKEVIEKLRDSGIGTQVHYIPVHTQPYYQKKFGYKAEDCPETMRYYSEVLSLPLYPAMTDDDVNYVIKNIISLEQI